MRQAGAWARGSGLIPVAVEAALARGDRPAAERLVAETEQALHGRDAPAAVAELHLARGLLLGASGPAAAECFDRARQLWSGIGRPYDTARAAERLGVALAPADLARAGLFLTDAITTYSELGASRDLARAQHSVQELGLAPSAARGRRGYGDQLSPREQQVTELLARGTTNQEIADALFLSPRTVEQHVARTLKKLGCTRGRVGEVLKRGKN